MSLRVLTGRGSPTLREEVEDGVGQRCRGETED